MIYKLDELQCRNLTVSSRREWLLTNGIGGYAMGTVSGINTRRYHGHLIAAVRPPTHRMVLLAAVDAFMKGDGAPMGISANQYPGAVYPEGFYYLKSFSVDGAAIWRYRAGGLQVAKRLALHPGANSATIEYENVGSKPLELVLRPLVCHKPHHDNFHESDGYPANLAFEEDQTVVQDSGVDLILGHAGADRQPIEGWYYRFEHQVESDRGLPDKDDLYCPCELRYRLAPGSKAVLTASTEPVRPLEIDPHEEDEFRLSAMFNQTAAKFFVQTPSRTSIIAGFPWFTDWGRDTMISIPGLCISARRFSEAREILLAYASQMHQGLIPNRFTEEGERPDYNTVDATLWFANAIYKILIADWDDGFARKIWPSLLSVFDWHMRGTLFGIGVDPADGLLSQGESGAQLTWMDAKIGDWVVTPRHGKPIEINGLWANFLRIMEWLAKKLGEDASPYSEVAELCFANFDRKFWRSQLGHYLDTVDPADASLRPNQVIAMALPFSPVDPEHARQALDVLASELLTANGLRTLGPKEPGYVGKFAGPMSERDAAYHQGTVWPWLMGSYATAIVKFKNDRIEAKRLLRSAREMMAECGLGGISEVYDGDEPQAPGGCPWQAWSVAEYARAWNEDVRGD